MSKKYKTTSKGNIGWRILHTIMSILFCPLMAFYDAYISWSSTAERAIGGPRIELIYVVGGISASITTIVMAVLLFKFPTPLLTHLVSLLSGGVFPPLFIAIFIILASAIIVRELTSLITAELYIVPEIKKLKADSGNNISIAKIRAKAFLSGYIGRSLDGFLVVPAPTKELEMLDMSRPARVRIVRPERKTTETKYLAESKEKSINEAEKERLIPSSTEPSPSASTAVPPPLQRHPTTYGKIAQSQVTPGASSDPKSILVTRIIAVLVQEEKINYSSLSADELKEKKITLKGDSEKLQTLIDKNDPTYGQLLAAVSKKIEMIEALESPAASATESSISLKSKAEPASPPEPEERSKDSSSMGS